MPKTRGRAACNTCRARKQKCDGIRLQETELALLKLLLSSQDETITKAFHPDSQSLARVYHEQFYGQLAEHDSPGGSEQKQRALRDQWEHCPLQTASDMKYWTERLMQSANNQPRDDIQQPSEAQPSFDDFLDNTEDQSLATFQSPSSVIKDPTVETQRQFDPVIQAQSPQTHIERTPSADGMQASREADRDHEVTKTGIELPTGFKNSFLW
ncbi:hypothetical protein NW762_012077 [Fusarium torreyae]|uniref:Zn(2)-C6 fungal-type domain-containing protein n=1 Tax=Fusarium torreyae TaxID=1237075 RepID=A0A9W8VBN6_9HYPO|nr:hypothetical protein NW762_012077 [Fusarium torreyae]